MLRPKQHKHWLKEKNQKKCFASCMNKKRFLYNSLEIDFNN